MSLQIADEISKQVIDVAPREAARDLSGGKPEDGVNKELPRLEQDIGLKPHDTTEQLIFHRAVEVSQAEQIVCRPRQVKLIAHVDTNPEANIVNMHVELVKRGEDETSAVILSEIIEDDGWYSFMENFKYSNIATL